MSNVLGEKDAFIAFVTCPEHDVILELGDLVFGRGIRRSTKVGVGSHHIESLRISKVRACPRRLLHWERELKLRRRREEGREGDGFSERREKESIVEMMTVEDWNQQR
ncbi:hypothetical protein ACLOJK_036246 [Asimina triloba]